jgi:hypothetical protein
VSTFPLVNLFPATTPSPPNTTFAKLMAAVSPPRPSVTFPDALSIARCLAKDRLNGDASSAAERAIGSNSEYKTWTKSTPALKAVPAVHNYRNGNPSSWNHFGVDAEVRMHGMFLPAGQELFHGGIWPGTIPASPGDLAHFTGVLSTSIDPQVAVAHAASHGAQGVVWLLTVPLGTSLQALALRNRRSERLGHEREVLIQAGAVVTCTQWHATSPFPVVECTLA